MPSIETVKRLVKRVILSNLATNKRNLYLTPLISGKHGIGKSQIIKSIADDIDGICFTIEGGTLKEGEITGIPYQYNDDEGQIHFRFLPYYVIEKIQKLEESYNEQRIDVLTDDVEPTPEEKIQKILNNEIVPVIVFIDEVNRTDNAVYKELMNILLTRVVNGYKLPWWVFFVAAMNPSNDDSIYQTNEMDPAQLDRFFKIVAKEDLYEWVEYAINTEMDNTLIEFVKHNGDVLSAKGEELEDVEEGTPSPRGWDMIDTIIKARKMINVFFTDKEEKQINNDIRILIEAKVGKKIAALYYQFLSQVNVYSLDIFLIDDENLSYYQEVKKDITSAGNAVFVNELTRYLKQNIKELKEDESSYKILILKIKKLLKLIDKSTALLFIQNAINEKDKENVVLFINLKDCFDEELLQMLNLTMASIEKLKKIA